MSAGQPATPVGRYAPSPTGMLHLGNLRTALTAYLHCRSRGGRFLLRVEDLDTPRVVTGCEDRQLADLHALGIDWDEAPLRQSNRAEIYEEAFQKLKASGMVYPCFASRKEVRDAASAPHRGDNPERYPGIYANVPSHETAPRIAAGEQHCWRLRVQNAPRTFSDGFAGEIETDLDRESGDFVVKRADGLFAYQLACAVDDSMTGVTEVLRGGDLLDSGVRQSWILNCLGLPIPRYWHIPLFLSESGERLSKRARADDLSRYTAEGYDPTAIRSYLACTLGQCNPGERLAMSDLIERFDLKKVPTADVRFNPHVLTHFRT